jgi:hypothetical protein
MIEDIVDIEPGRLQIPALSHEKMRQPLPDLPQGEGADMKYITELFYVNDEGVHLFLGHVRN